MKQNKQINLNKEQYRALIRFLQVAGTVYPILGDMVDEKYKLKSDEIDDIESYFLKFAGDFEMQDMVEKFRGKFVLKEEYTEEAMDDLLEYEEYSFWENLARKFAERDFSRKHNRKQREKMSQEESISAQCDMEKNIGKNLKITV